MRVQNSDEMPGYARQIIVIALFVLNFIFFLSPPVSAQSLTHTTPSTMLRTSRLSLPVSGSATVVIENKEGVEKKSIVVSDYLSSTKAIIDETGKVIDNPEYYPYGNPTTPSIPRGTTTEEVIDRYYTGQRKVTDDSSVYNYNARYYNPDIGLFIQPDPVEGINRFAYVGGNPIMNNDPSGHMCDSANYELDQKSCSGNAAYAHHTEMANWSQSKEHDAMLLFTTGVMDVYNMGDFDNTAMGISSIGRGSMGKGGGKLTLRRFWEDESGRFFGRSGGGNPTRVSAKTSKSWNWLLYPTTQSRAYSQLKVEIINQYRNQIGRDPTKEELVQYIPKYVRSRLPYDDGLKSLAESRGSIVGLIGDADRQTTNTGVLSVGRGVCRNQAPLCFGVANLFDIAVRPITLRSNNKLFPAHMTVIADVYDGVAFRPSGGNYYIMDATSGKATPYDEYISRHGFFDAEVWSFSQNKPVPFKPR